MTEVQSIRMLPQPSTVSGSGIGTEVENVIKESARPTSRALDLCRVDPCAEVIRSFETTNARFDLLKFSKQSSPELEFLTSSHLIIFSNDSISKGWEWSDGHQNRMLPPVSPYTLIFNPPQNYLRIRAPVLKKHCQMLILTIHSSLMRWRNDLEMDLAAVRFQQKIGLSHEAICRTLISMRQELEAPGINAALCLDMLLFLLFTQMIRSASNLAEPSKMTYAKGGLPNWRLKRAIELLEGDLNKTPSLSEVAESIRLHPTSFCRAFKQSTGLSPHRYLLVHRIESAKKG
jgi:hypothetical protein